MKIAKILRTVAGYSALAIGVTVGGVLIGATVVAPIIAPSTASSTAPAKSVSMLHLAKDFTNAMPSFDRIPNFIWLFVAGTSAVLLAVLVAWRLWKRNGARTVQPASGSLDVAAIASAAMPSKLAGEKKRTPRAVQALAEAGTTPADIARRTGLPLDAVVLCLAMSPIGARQLRPPTA